MHELGTTRTGRGQKAKKLATSVLDLNNSRSRRSAGQSLKSFAPEDLICESKCTSVAFGSALIVLLPISAAGHDSWQLQKRLRSTSGREILRASHEARTCMMSSLGDRDVDRIAREWLHMLLQVETLSIIERTASCWLLLAPCRPK